jgi:hypothetical protein
MKIQDIQKMQRRKALISGKWIKQNLSGLEIVRDPDWQSG